MKITPRRDYMMSLESVAMTDIVLNMFIFFFISFSLLYTFAKQPGIKVTLPTAKTATSQEKNVTVFISRENEIFLGDKKIKISELRNVLEEKLDTSHKRIVILKSDERVNLGLAVKVMDIAKQAAAEGLIILTKAEENAK